MERIIGLGLLGGTLYLLVALRNEAREQGWRWPARIALYLAGGVIAVLSVLVILGSTQAVQWLFVGIGAVLAAIVLLFMLFALYVGWVALRERDSDADTDSGADE